jgi:hypothetical protein
MSSKWLCSRSRQAFRLSKPLLAHEQIQDANTLESERRFCQANLGRAACDLKADFAKRRLYKTFRNDALGHELREKVSRHSELVQQQNIKNQAGASARRNASW